MSGTVPEIGIAESDMLRAACYLATNICQHDVGRHGEEAAMIDWCDRAVQAGMLAAARRFSVTGETQFTIVLQASVAFERLQMCSFGHKKRRARYPWAAGDGTCAYTWDSHRLVSLLDLQG